MALRTVYSSTVKAGYRLQVGRPGVIIVAEGSNPRVRLRVVTSEGPYSLLGTNPATMLLKDAPEAADPAPSYWSPDGGLSILDADGGLLELDFAAADLVVPGNRHYILRSTKGTVTTTLSYGRLHIADY